MLLPVLAALVAGYLVGAVPTAVLIARRAGVDIFREGSGNPGATNVKRSVGKGAGNLCFVLDALKGIVSAGWPALAFAGSDPASTASAASVAGLLAAILGHSFSVFIGFRGGKGVATTMGGLLVVMPAVLLGGVAVWLAVFFAARYVSLASLCFGLALPVGAHLAAEPAVDLGLSYFLAVLILVRHRANIRRLIDGTENRFSRGGGAAGGTGDEPPPDPPTTNE